MKFITKVQNSIFSKLLAHKQWILKTLQKICIQSRPLNSWGLIRDPNCLTLRIYISANIWMETMNFCTFWRKKMEQNTVENKECDKMWKTNKFHFCWWIIVSICIITIILTMVLLLLTQFMQKYPSAFETFSPLLPDGRITFVIPIPEHNKSCFPLVIQHVPT